jgi:hypothetical protein
MPIITVIFLPEEQTSHSHIIFGSSYGMAAVFKKYELYKHYQKKWTEKGQMKSDISNSSGGGGSSQ